MLSTSKGDIVRRWKEYFEDFLNPNNLPSLEEVQLDDTHGGICPSPRLRSLKPKNPLVVSYLKAEEIRPEFLKALDLAGCLG